jgi:hypothetical protein
MAQAAERYSGTASPQLGPTAFKVAVLLACAHMHICPHLPVLCKSWVPLHSTSQPTKAKLAVLLACAVTCEVLCTGAHDVVDVFGVLCTSAHMHVQILQPSARQHARQPYHNGIPTHVVQLQTREMPRQATHISCCWIRSWQLHRCCTQRLPATYAQLLQACQPSERGQLSD